MRSFSHSSTRSELLPAQQARERDTGEWPQDPRFEAVFQRYYSSVVQVLCRVVGDSAQAEELADDVFWKLHNQPGLLAQEDLGGWLYRTATHAGIDAIRSRGRRSRHEMAASRTGQGAPPTPLDETLQAERARLVREALARLKPAQAQILVLRHGGLSYKELAEVLDVKPSSIGTLLTRAEAEFEKVYRRVAGQEGK